MHYLSSACLGSLENLLQQVDQVKEERIRKVSNYFQRSCIQFPSIIADLLLDGAHLFRFT